METLRTARLTLIPLTLDLLRAAVREPAEVGKVLGVRIVPGWPNAEEMELFPWLAGAMERDPGLVEWGQTIVIHDADRALIGTAGFKGGPDETGTVEIGYGVVPSYQGHGYATEAVAGLIAWAFAHPEVARVYADCLPKNQASARVLTKLGLRQLPPSPELLHWELRRPDWPARRAD